MADPGRDGNEVDLEYARGRGNVTAYNKNESLVTRLFHDGLIGLPEKEAGDYLGKLWHRASVGSLSVPEIDRIPGQGDMDITGIQAMTIDRLNHINKNLSTDSYNILFEVLVRDSGIAGIRSVIMCQKGKGHERVVLRHALRELAEVTGHATKGYADGK